MDQLPVPARTHSGPPRKISTVCPCILQAKANIWTIFWWHSKRKTETFFTWNGDTFAELLLNLFWMYFAWTLMNFLWILKCIWNVLHWFLYIYYYYVLYWFLLWIWIDLLIDLVILKDLINFIGLYCIVILLHYVCYGIEVWDNTG